MAAMSALICGGRSGGSNSAWPDPPDLGVLGLRISASLWVTSFSAVGKLRGHVSQKCLTTAPPSRGPT